MNFDEFAKEIIVGVGGKENVDSLSHCATRLRFILKDDSKADLEMIKKIKGVLGAVYGAGQLQVIMGKNLLDSFSVLQKKYNFTGEEENDSIKRSNEKKHPKTIALDVLNFISGSVSTVITGLIAGGMLKLALFIASMIAPGIAENSTYLFLTFVCDVPFYFMPILVAYGASKKLGMQPVYPMLVACALLHPTFNEIVAAGNSVSLFGLPVMLVGYSSSMLPALLSTVCVYYIEKFFNKIVPGILKSVVVGAMTITIGAVLTFVVIGPLGTFLGNYVVGFIIWLQELIGPVALGVLTGILPFMVMMGMHTLLAPFLVQNITTLGHDSFFRPALILHVVAEGGAAIGVGLRTKNKELRAEALSIGVGSVFAGISEPAIYGIALRFKKPFYGVVAGGFFGGIIAGLFNVRAYTMSKTTLLAAPIFKETMVGMLIACGVAFIVSVVVTYIVGINEDELEATTLDSSPKATEPVNSIVAIATGETIPLESVNDEVFSSKSLGEGVAFKLLENRIVSPINGTVVSVFPSGHAIGLRSNDGMEILIHIGIDTVRLNGKGFKVKVQNEESVNAGQELVELDMDYLSASELDLTTMMIITEQKGKTITLENFGCVTAGESPIAEMNLS